MRSLTATFLSVLLAAVLASPSRADRGPAEEEAAPAAEAALQLASGLFATAVQLSVYGSCRVLGGRHLPCLEDADVAGRRAVGRPLPLDEREAG